MANGYTRQSSAHIVNGEIITAPPLNNEFNAIVAAFDAVDGHAHDGSAGNAPPIDLTTSVSNILQNAHGGVGYKHNTAASTNPTTTNDGTEDYGPGSLWVNTADGRLFVCLDGTTNAARWREVLGVESNQFLPSAHGVVDLGVTGTRFRNLFLSGTLTTPQISTTKFTGNVNMDNNKITNVGTPTSNGDAASKSYVDTAVANLINSAPGTLDTLKELADAIGNDANFSSTMASALNAKLSLSGGTMSGVLNMGNNRISNVATPSQGSDATNKQYVDAVVGTADAAALSASQAANSANAAANSANTAAGYASEANTHRQTANSRANAANQSANEAAGSANAAQQALEDAEDARDLAKDWANKTGSPVANGEYSAKHYAQVADDWANAPVDQEIAPGKYSGLHWATKAQASSGYAPNPASNPNKYLYSTLSDYTFKTAQQIVNESYEQGAVTIRSGSAVRNNTSGNSVLHIRTSDGTNRSSFIFHEDSNTTRIQNRNSSGSVNGYISIEGSGANQFKFENWTVYHSGNTGAGSGMDADLLDGQQGSYYRNASNLNAGTINNARLSGDYSFGNLTLSGGLTASGNVEAAVGRFTSTTDVSLSSTGHGLQVGPTDSTNLAFDQNEIMCRNNGNTAPLHIQWDGGETRVGGTLVVNGTISGNGSGITNINGNNIASGTINQARIGNLPATKVTSGTFDAARIPNLDAGKVTTGTFDVARIPNLDAGKITSGTLNANRIPNLNASKITAGTIADARISGTYTNISINNYAGSVNTGTLRFRNQARSESGDINLSSGNMAADGWLRVGQYLRTNAGHVVSNGGNMIISTVLGSGGSGHVYLRPRGTNSSDSQCYMHNNGSFYVPTGGVHTAGLRISVGDDGAITRNTGNSWSALSGGTAYNTGAAIIVWGQNASNNNRGELRSDNQTRLRWDDNGVWADNGASGLHTVATVESSGSASHTDFTIGHLVFVRGGRSTRRSSDTVRLHTGNNNDYAIGGSGTILSGTWRHCGGAADDGTVIQRVA